VSGRDVRWGFIGAGFIARAALAPAVHAADGATLEAAASRDVDRARSLSPQTAYDDYQRLADDPDVDAVYICLSNEAHLPWILAALRAGKHVLCEKPLTLNAAECRMAYDEAAAQERLLVEAAWTRWHPRHRRADQLLGQQANGTVRSIRAEFTFDGVPMGNYRLDARRGGGALLDLGPYVLAPLVDWCPPEWTSVSGTTRLNDLGADLTTSAGLRSDTAEAAIHVSICEPERQTLVVTTDALTLTWGSPAHTSWREESSLTIDDGSGSPVVERFAECDAYQLMVEDVSRAVRDKAFDVLPASTQSLATATLIDEVAAACEPLPSATATEPA
jgi:predicted dehydrogenase